MQNAKYLSDNASKAMHSLFQIIKGVETPINITLQLFDTSQNILSVLQFSEHTEQAYFAILQI